MATLRQVTLPILLLAASPFVVLSSPVSAEEHIDVKVVAEWPVDTPGVENIELRRVEFAPGAELELTIEHFDFCNGTQGQWSVTNQETGTTTVYNPGSRWRMPAKGTTVTISNPGNEPAVQWVYRLIEPGM